MISLLKFDFCAAGHHYRGQKVRHEGPSGDALFASDGAKGSWGGTFLRQGYELQQGIGLVSDADAAFLPRPDHHREEPELFCYARGKCALQSIRLSITSQK